MQASIKFPILVCVIILLFAGMISESIAEQAVDDTKPEAKKQLTYPYIAEVTGDDVYIRSGPGTNYYPCGKAKKGDRIKVVGSKFSWSQIVPSQGCFSWISKQYVKSSPDEPGIGIVDGDKVRVHAGSANGMPMHSTTVQMKLDRKYKVKLMNEEKDGYYKIMPPAGAYLWISTMYIKPVMRTGKVPADLPPSLDVPKKTEPDLQVPMKAETESDRLKVYYTVQEQIETEKAKPLEKQDYDWIKSTLVSLVNNGKDDKAARYAQIALKQVEGFGLALKATKEIEHQEEYLQDVYKRIEQARAQRINEMVDLGQYAAIGKFQTSNIYGPDVKRKYYRMIDQQGRIICYALPVTEGVFDLSQFVGRTIGLVGTIEPHEETSGALVRFSEIVELNQ